MKLPFEQWQFILFCRGCDSDNLPEKFTDTREYLRFGETDAWHLVDETDIDMLNLTEPHRHSLSRYLDHFYLWNPPSILHHPQSLLDTVFELLANRYEQFIVPTRNLQNIRILMLALRNHLGQLQGRYLVDFGCGPGLSAVVAQKLEVGIFGVDRCPTMRNLARSKGLRVLEPEDLQFSLHHFAGIFASYVLHLPFDLSDLGAIWLRLPLRGALVGNFHKNHGLDRVDSFMTTLGAEFCTIEPVGATFEHGTYRKYVRNK